MLSSVTPEKQEEKEEEEEEEEKEEEEEEEFIHTCKRSLIKHTFTPTRMYNNCHTRNTYSVYVQA